MTIPLISQPAGSFPRAPFTNDQTQEDVVTNLNAAATAINTGTGAGTNFVNVKAAPYNAKGDGTTDDTLAIQAANDAAAATGLPLYFPQGNYLVTNQGTSFGIPYHALIVTQSNVSWAGDGTATITWDSRTCNAVHIGTGTSNFSCSGMFFQGYAVAPAANEFITNFGVVFYVAAAVLDLDISHCYFEHATPNFIVSDDVSMRFTFNDNRVINSPNAINGASYSTVTNNWFMNDSAVSTRSHAVYLFGHFEKVIITGNHFKNITSADVQIRATDARHLQKRTFLVANNIFEFSREYAIWIAGGARVNVGSGLITGNQFRNCSAAAFMYSARDVLFTGNTIEYDYEYVGASGFGVNVSTATSDSVATGCVIADNIFLNRHPYFAALVVASEPADGDTVVIGSQTYTWRTTPSTAGDVQRSSNVDTCAANLGEMIAGHASGAGAIGMNLVLRNDTDIMYSQSGSGEGLCVIASEETFTATFTGTAVSFKTTRAYLEPAGIPADDPTFDTVIQATSAHNGTAGNSLSLTVTGDAVTKAGTIDDSTSAVVLHFEPGVSQVSDMEALIATSTHIMVKTSGVLTNVLDSTAAFGTQPLSGGRDAVVVGTFCNPAIQVGQSRETTIARNKITGCTGGFPVVITTCYKPRITDNQFHDCGGLGINSDHNAFPVFERNRITVTNDRPGRPNNIAAVQILQSYDAFPVIRDMDLIGRVTQYAQDNMLPHLQGVSGVVAVGDQKNFGFLWYGNEPDITDDDASCRSFRWENGDQFAVLDDNTTYTFTFSRTITSATTQFNSYASLMNLINTQTGGEWVASNPVSTYFGADSFGDGYMLVKAASTGVNANGYMAVVAASGQRLSLMNGLLLVKWTEGDTFAYMAGGASTAIKTVVFTPLASKNIPLHVYGVDATSQALAPIAYQADTIPGVCYVITHSAAAGTEKFFWSLGQ